MNTITNLYIHGRNNVHNSRRCLEYYWARKHFNIFIFFVKSKNNFFAYAWRLEYSLTTFLVISCQIIDSTFFMFKRVLSPRSKFPGICQSPESALSRNKARSPFWKCFLDPYFATTNRNPLKYGMKKWVRIYLDPGFKLLISQRWVQKFYPLDQRVGNGRLVSRPWSLRIAFLVSRIVSEYEKYLQSFWTRDVNLKSQDSMINNRI